MLTSLVLQYPQPLIWSWSPLTALQLLYAGILPPVMLLSRVTNSPGILMASQRAQLSSSTLRTTNILLQHLVSVSGYTET